MGQCRADDTAEIAAWIFFTILAIFAIIAACTALTLLQHHNWLMVGALGGFGFGDLALTVTMLYWAITANKSNHDHIFKDLLSAYHRLTPEMRQTVKPLMHELSEEVKNGGRLEMHDPRVTSIEDLASHELARRGQEHVELIKHTISGLDEIKAAGGPRALGR